MNDAVYSEYDLALHVKEVLVSFSSGDVESSENYRNLVAVLHRKKNLSPRDVAELVAILKGLSGAAAYIDSAHCDLYSAIFNMSLWNYGPGVMDAMIELIIALATSSGKYLDICLEMLVSNFVSQDPYMLDKLKVPHGLKKKDQVLTRVHRALKVISDLSPLSPRNLLILVYRGLNGYYTRKGTVSLPCTRASTKVLTQKMSFAIIIFFLIPNEIWIDHTNKKQVNVCQNLVFSEHSLFFCCG